MLLSVKKYYHTLAYFLVGSSIRRNELLNLSWDDINLSDGNAFVRVKASIAKNGKEAQQPIPPAMVSLLQALKARIRPNDLCPSAGGLTRQGFSETI
jgi:integrase